MELINKSVVVTGASQGIGAAIALAFAENQARVVLCYRSNKAGAEKVLAEVQKHSPDSFLFAGDLSDEATVKNLFSIVKERFGTVDILVNNAGKSVPQTLEQTSKADWLKAFDDNFFNAVLCSKYALELMLPQNSGKILNMSSINGLDYVGRPGNITYSAAKAAIPNFTKTLAKACAPYVLVNAVAPGATFTDYWAGVDQEFRNRSEAKFPIKRFIEPREIADVFIFLAKNDALTGTVIVADGGFNLKDYN